MKLNSVNGLTASTSLDMQTPDSLTGTTSDPFISAIQMVSYSNWRRTDRDLPKMKGWTTLGEHWLFLRILNQRRNEIEQTLKPLIIRIRKKP